MKRVCSVLLVLTIVGCGAGSSEQEDLAAVQKARDKADNALRTNDGEQACKLMTRRVQRQLAAAMLREAPLIAGTDCITLIDAYGKEMATPRGDDRANERSTGDCVEWQSPKTGEYRRAIKDDGWKFDGTGRCD